LHGVGLALGLGGPWRFLVRLRWPAEEGPTPRPTIPHQNAPAENRKPRPPPREVRGVGQSPMSLFGLTQAAALRRPFGPGAGAGRRQERRRADRAGAAPRMRGALNQ